MTAFVENNESIGPVEEPYRLGEVLSVKELPAELFEIAPDLQPVAIYGVDIIDPYVEKYSMSERQQIWGGEAIADALARERRLAGRWERRKGQAYVDKNDVAIQDKQSWGDPVSAKIFFETCVNNAGVNAWHRMIPNATSLALLSDPGADHKIYDEVGERVDIDYETKKWLSLTTDAMAIRSRATVMSEIVKEYIVEQTASGQSNDIKWMSIACGTALPAMKAAVHAGIKPDLTLVDFDKNAMSATETLAQEIGFEGKLTKITLNIFKENRMSKLRDALAAENKLPHLVDLMGIFEYTGENLGVDSAEFLKSCFGLVRPGGKLVFGQMRSDRPVPDFTLGVVGWPHIEMRSPKEFMDVIAKAGIDPATTQLYMPIDGVYTVGVINQPDEM